MFSWMFSIGYNGCKVEGLLWINTRDVCAQAGHMLFMQHKKNQPVHYRPVCCRLSFCRAQSFPTERETRSSPAAASSRFSNLTRNACKQTRSAVESVTLYWLRVSIYINKPAICISDVSSLERVEGKRGQCVKGLCCLLWLKQQEVRTETE